MSRPTDTERGARLAARAAVERMQQEDLFEDVPPSDFWERIFHSAAQQLAEERWAREVRA